MKKLNTLLLVLALPFFSMAQYNTENLTISASKSEVSQLNPKPDQHQPASAPVYSFKNLRIFPIYASEYFQKAHADMGKFTTLREAQEKKQVLITERSSQAIQDAQEENTNGNERVNNNVAAVQSHTQMQNPLGGGGETVNTLMIENISPDTVYIMAGEVIKGGKQDRVIAQDMILPPNSGKIDLSVFCVEHGRWTYKNSAGDDFKSANYIAPASVRKEVEVTHNQQAVWDGVASNNMKNGTSSNSDALTSNEENEKFQKELKEYIEHPVLKNLPDLNPNMVGVVAVSGDKVVGCDIFATHQLFQAQYEPLLASYASETVTNGGPVKMTEKEVEQYLNNFLANEDTQEESIKGNGKVYFLEVAPGVKRKTRLTSF